MKIDWLWFLKMGGAQVFIGGGLVALLMTVPKPYDSYILYFVLVISVLLTTLLLSVRRRTNDQSESQRR